MMGRFTLFVFVVLILCRPSFAEDTATATSESQGQKIERLIAQLGDDDFERREAAQAALEKIGPAARASLSKAQNHADFEIAWRARYLLRRIHVEWARKDDPAQVAKLFGRYEFLSDQEKVERIRLMAAQADEIRATTLSRITRFETNEDLSKLAALALLGMDPLRIVTASDSELDVHEQILLQNRLQFQMGIVPQQVPWGILPGGMMPAAELDLTEQPEPLADASSEEESSANELDAKAMAAVVEKELGKCARPGANWIRTALRFESDEDAEAFLSAWRRLREAEEKGPGSEEEPETNQIRQAVADQMLWYETDVLFRLNRRDEALASARRLMENAVLGPEDLGRLVDWFSKYQQTELLSELAEKRTADFNRNPLLLYQIAEGFRKSGEEARAEALANKALGLNQGTAPMNLLIRQHVADVLYKRGAVDWAERELQYVVDHARTGGADVLRAVGWLSSMQFEDGRPLDAARGLHKFLETERQRGNDNPTLTEYKAQRDYYFSQHYKKTGDRDKEREYLVRALKSGAHESEMTMDLLIAAWQAEGLPDDMRKTVRARVEAMLARERRSIAARPTDVGSYNNYAWLSANTKLGDVKEALEFSKKSVELEPDRYAYWDTLAHCHYAVGDLDNAVKCQEKAAKMAPHCKIITSKLDFFRKARDAAQKGRSPSAEPPAAQTPAAQTPAAQTPSTQSSSAPPQGGTSQ